MSIFARILAGVLLFVLCFCGCLAGFPYYLVWQQKMAGEAELAKAKQNRQIKIAEAEAESESAELHAAAEVKRAKGVAEANKIIGDSLQGHHEYLLYLWITGLDRNGQDVIYVPTEAGLPILEAGRFRELDRNHGRGQNTGQAPIGNVSPPSE